MSRLAMIRIPDYDSSAIDYGLATAFSELGLLDLFLADEKILIKPNLLAAVSPERAVTPHPTVFDSLIQVLRPTGVQLSYGDSPAMSSPGAAAQATGLKAVAIRQGVPLADFSAGRETILPAARRLQKAYLAQGVLDSDGLVNLCKLKTHALTGMTGAVKNLFGVITGARKAQLHVTCPDPVSFAQMLVELNTQLKARVVVMDAIVALEGNGPLNGRPKSVGLLLVGTDPVAIDAFGAAVMGFVPKSLPVLAAAEQAGLGWCDLDRIHVLPIDATERRIEPWTTARAILPQVLVPDFIRPKIESSVFTRLTKLGGPLLKQHVLSRPVIDGQICTRCGQCVQACPLDPKALRQSDRRQVPLYRYDRCIRCYCCQEICPAGAISVQKAPIGRAAARLHRLFRKA